MEPGLNIRPAARADAPRIHELHAASVRALCGAHYAPGVIEGWLRDRSAAGYHEAIDRGEVFVAEEDGALAGFGEAVPGEIAAVFVDPARAGRGIGTALARHALRIAQSAPPVVLEATLNAVPFYRRLGFREVREGTARRARVSIPIVVMEFAG